MRVPHPFRSCLRQATRSFPLGLRPHSGSAATQGPKGSPAEPSKCVEHEACALTSGKLEEGELLGLSARLPRSPALQLGKARSRHQRIPHIGPRGAGRPAPIQGGVGVVGIDHRARHRAGPNHWQTCRHCHHHCERARRREGLERKTQRPKLWRSKEHRSATAERRSPGVTVLVERPLCSTFLRLCEVLVQ